MALIDLISKAFGGQPGASLGLPELQNGFQDYGPWGAGGGQPGPGAFPQAPAQPSPDMIQQAVAQAQAGPQQNFQPTAMMPQQPDQAPQVQPQLPEYNRMLDPNGGLFGKIGRLMGSPTRAEAQAGRNSQQLSAGIQEVKKRVDQGMSPQKAIMDYLATPGGQQWLMSPGADPVAELHNYVTATKGPTADVREAGGSIVREQTPGAGDYKAIYTPPPSEKDQVQVAKDRADMKMAADRYKLDVQKYNDEKAQTGVTNAQKEQELQNAGDQLKINQDRLGMDLKLGEAQIAKSKSDVEQAGKTPMQNDYENAKKEWEATYSPDKPFPYKTVDDYKKTFTKLANPGGTQLSPALDKASLEWFNAAQTAENQMRAYDQALTMADNTDTGWMEAVSLPFRNMAASIGLLTPEQAKTLSSQQVFEAMTNDMALGKRGHNVISGEVGLTGNTSDKDLNFLIKSVANLWNTPLANKAMLVLAKAQARRSALINTAQAEYARTTGDVTGWDKEKKALIDQTPYFTASEDAMLKSMNEQAKLTPKATANPNGVTPPAGQQDLPPDTFEANDPARATLWKNLDAEGKAYAKAQSAAKPNVRNNEQLLYKGGGPAPIANATPTAAPVPQAPAATPIPGPNPMVNEAPQGAGGSGLMDMMLKFMQGGDGAAPAPTVGPTPSPQMPLGGQSGQDMSFQQPATPDNFITLQDIMKMFSGRQ